MVCSLGIFSILIAAMPNELYLRQPDYIPPATIDKAVADYYSANNITIYTYSYSFDITYPDGYAYNESGLSDGHRVEIFWDTLPPVLGGDAALEFKHAYPSPLGDWWLLSNIMYVQEPYVTLMGLSGGGLDWGGAYIDKTQLLRLSRNSNSSYFEVSDGEITANFVFMNPGGYASLSDAWDANDLHALSSYEVDFEAMKPNAFWLIAQIVTFQAPDLGIPGDFGTILTYSFAVGFWIVTALIIYTIVTKLIPTIQGGIEN